MPSKSAMKIMLLALFAVAAVNYLGKKNATVGKVRSVVVG